MNQTLMATSHSASDDAVHLARPEIQSMLKGLQDTMHALASSQGRLRRKLEPVLMSTESSAATAVGVLMEMPTTPLGRYVQTLQLEAQQLLEQSMDIETRIGF